MLPQCKTLRLFQSGDFCFSTFVRRSICRFLISRVEIVHCEAARVMCWYILLAVRFARRVERSREKFVLVLEACNT